MKSLRTAALLIFFPLLGLTFTLVAGLLARPALIAHFCGTPPEPARVVAMLLNRDGLDDLVIRMETDIELRTLSGIVLRQQNLQGQLSETQIQGDLPDPERSRLASIAHRCQMADTSEILRILRREARANNPHRLQFISKRETATVIPNLKDGTQNLVWHQENSVVSLANLDPSQLGRLVTHAEFSYNPAEVRPKVTMSSFQVEVHGTNALQPKAERKDFILYREPWTTEFRPIVRTLASSDQSIILSDNGRHGRPGIGFTLFSDCLVRHFKPHHILVDRLGRPENPETPKMERFSLWSEMFFARWAYPLIAGSIGLVLLVTGGILISLHLSPPRHLHVTPHQG